MMVLKYILLIVEVVVSILLIGVVLLQRSKDQGMGGLAFGSGMGESLFGAQAGNVLTKITITLVVIFFLNTAILARIFSAIRLERSVMEGSRIPSAAPVGPAAPRVPSGPAPAEPVEEAVPPSADNMSTPVEAPAGDDMSAPVEPPAGDIPASVETAPAEEPESSNAGAVEPPVETVPVEE